MAFWDNVRRNSGLAGDPAWRKFVVRWSLASLVLIAVACYFSYGMFKLDEYYQVVEFVGYKLGKTPAAELPWEFHDQIRPWLQPAIYYAAAKGLIGLGVENPFTLTMAFRAISGVCGWAAITALMLASNTLFGDDRRRRIAVVLLAMLWLIPYLAVRTSSESMSCSFLSLGAAVLLLGSAVEPEAATGEPSRVLKKGTGTAQQTKILDEIEWPRGASPLFQQAAKRRFPPLAVLLAGVCFGLAFEFRLQIAFSIGGALGWIWLTSADAWLRTWSKLALVCFASLVPIAAGTLIDRWGYGQWTFAPWNYFHADVVLGIPNQDSVSPFWWYFFDTNANPLAPITLLWTLAMLIAWVRFPRNIITWFTLPFFLGHSVFPHKEVRYLFPIVLLSVFFFVLAYVPERDEAAQPAWLRAVWRRRKSWFAIVLYGLNIAGLLYGCVSAKQPSVNFQKYVYDHYPQGCTLYLLGEDTKSPYENVGLNMYFYRPPNLIIERLPGNPRERKPGEVLQVSDHPGELKPGDVLQLTAIDVLNNKLCALRPRFSPPRDVLIVRDRVTPWADQNLIAFPAELVYATYPAWMENYNYFGWLQHSKRFSLYEPRQGPPPKIEFEPPPPDQPAGAGLAASIRHDPPEVKMTSVKSTQPTDNKISHE
jgi:phosphatidylinositol glycan class B